MMKKNIYTFLFSFLVLVSVFFNGCDKLFISQTHECASICHECQKCLEKDCADSVRMEKCDGHIALHTCESVCAECQKCLNLSCTENVCEEKCKGHVAVHECESICVECQKCLNYSCVENACEGKCLGHTVFHVCQNICSDCGKCLNPICLEIICSEKCAGHIITHDCESVCIECKKCLDLTCLEAVCKEKCNGHLDSSKLECEICKKCIDENCEEHTDKCAGHRFSRNDKGAYALNFRGVESINYLYVRIKIKAKITYVDRRETIEENKFYVKTLNKNNEVRFDFDTKGLPKDCKVVLSIEILELPNGIGYKLSEYEKEQVLFENGKLTENFNLDTPLCDMDTMEIKQLNTKTRLYIIGGTEEDIYNYQKIRDEIEFIAPICDVYNGDVKEYTFFREVIYKESDYAMFAIPLLRGWYAPCCDDSTFVDGSGLAFFDMWAQYLLTIPEEEQNSCMYLTGLSHINGNVFMPCKNCGKTTDNIQTLKDRIGDPNWFWSPWELPDGEDGFSFDSGYVSKHTCIDSFVEFGSCDLWAFRVDYKKFYYENV